VLGTEVLTLRPIKSIRTPMRSGLDKASTVAMKLANGPFSTRNSSPAEGRTGGSILPDASQRSISPDTRSGGSALGYPSKLTNRDTPIVLLILRHGALSSSNATNM